MAPKKDAKKADAAAAAPAAAAATKKEEKKEVEAGGKPPKPDEEEYKRRMEAVTKQIDAKKEQISKLSQKIGDLSHGKEDYEKEKNALFEVVNASKEERQALMATKQEVIHKKKAQKQEARDAKDKMRQLEGSMEMTEDEIDDKIQKIEYTMSTSSMTLKEEKDCMMQIKKLKAKKPQVIQAAKQYERMKAQCDAATAPDPTKSVDEQLNEINEKIKAIQDAQDVQYKKINELKEKRTQQMGGVQGLIDEKTKLKGECEELQGQRSAVGDERRKMQKAFNEWEKEQRAERRRKQDAEWAKQHAEWDAEEAKRQLEKPNPYLNETTLLEQTIDYCKGLLPREDSGEAEKKDLDFNNPEGAKILVSKKDRDQEFYFAPTKKKNLKRKGGEKGKATAVKHTADTFQIFQQLKLAAPMTTDDVPPLLEKLEKSLAGYMEKVKKWEGERLEKLKAAEESGSADAAKTAEWFTIVLY